MSETSQTPQTPQTPPTDRTDTQRVPPQTRGRASATETPERSQAGDSARPSGFLSGTGGIVFASTVLLLMGAFQVIMGLTALLNTAFFNTAESGLALNVNYPAWGWAHLLVGALALATGLGLVTGQTWARALGIALATASAIINMAFIPAFPLWALTIIALDIVVIYAIAMHGAHGGKPAGS